MVNIQMSIHFTANRQQIIFLNLLWKPKKSSEKDECVKVVVRCRPMDEKEVRDKYERVVNIDGSRGVVSVKKQGSEEPDKEFTFDAVYDWK